MGRARDSLLAGQRAHQVPKVGLPFLCFRSEGDSEGKTSSLGRELEMTHGGGGSKGGGGLKRGGGIERWERKARRGGGGGGERGQENRGRDSFEV